MTTEQPSSDRLASLRRIAEGDIASEQCSDVNPRELLALVECVETLQSIVLDMESGWLANHGKAAERNYELLLETALKALEKLK